MIIQLSIITVLWIFRNSCYHIVWFLGNWTPTICPIYLHIALTLLLMRPQRSIELLCRFVSFSCSFRLVYIYNLRTYIRQENHDVHITIRHRVKKMSCDEMLNLNDIFVIKSNFCYRDSFSLQSIEICCYHHILIVSVHEVFSLFSLCIEKFS